MHALQEADETPTGSQRRRIQHPRRRRYTPTVTVGVESSAYRSVGDYISPSAYKGPSAYAVGGPHKSPLRVSVARLYADGVPVGLVGAIRRRPPRRRMGLLTSRQVTHPQTTPAPARLTSQFLPSQLPTNNRCFTDNTIISILLTHIL